MSERIAMQPAAVTLGWRPKVGLLLFVLALVSPFLSPLVLATDLPAQSRGAMAGLLLFGVPMALILGVVALIGRPAYAFIVSPPGRGMSTPAVGVARYRIGLVLIVLAALASWLEPLVAPHVPMVAARRVLIGALADGLVLVGLFVVGGEFWDKVRALFVHDARVTVDSAPVSPVGAALEPVQVGWRFYLGAAIFVAAFAAWLLVPAASAAGWSTSQVASLTGGIFIANKLGLLAAIAVMGKPGFNHLKRLLVGVFRKIGPPQQVSRSRYLLGLILFMVPVLMTWIAPYAPTLLGTAGVYGFLESRALEALLLVGLFLLGGEFWDKFGALFKHRAKVEFVPAR